MNRAIAFIAITAFVLVLSLLRSMDSADAPVEGAVAVETTEQLAKSEGENGPQAVASSAGEVVLHRGADSHFRATVKINGVDIDMLVDSGASVVALSQADAERVGLFSNPSEFSATAQGAGGAVPVKPVKLDRVALGPIEKHDVQGVIIGSDMNQSLLGQSFLKQIGSVTIKDDTMTIK